jgi:circadian clock protein KaiC
LTERLSTGIRGLDDVLRGGLLPGQIYMVRGAAGTGKTTLGVQFLMAGARAGEATLFVSLVEPERGLRASASAHDWDLSGVEILDIHAGLGDEGFSPEGQYTIFHPADIELAPVTRKITEAMDRLRPARVVFDSLTEVGFLTRDAVRYRRQILALKDYLLNRGATTLWIADSNHRRHDEEVLSLVHGIIQLAQVQGRDGGDRRSLRVEKYRDSGFAAGEHALDIVKEGLVVYPRMVAQEHGREFPREVIPSGVEGLDRLLGGGIDRGTTTLVSGSSGTGKTTVGMSFLAAAARRGERAVAFTFEEGPEEIIFRCDALGLGVGALVGQGVLAIRKVNPLVLYPDQFAAWVRAEVEQEGTQLLMIDSLNGYRQVMPEEDYLVSHMHQLTSYLKRMGVATILTNEMATLTDAGEVTRFGVSHLVDTILLLKFFEFEGALRTAAGAVKRRLGPHERAFRAMEITPEGIRVGETLPQFRGILRGEADSRGLGSADKAQPPEGGPGRG